MRCLIPVYGQSHKQMMCDVPLLLHLDCRLTAGEDKPLCMHDSNAMVEVVANDLQISFQDVCPVSLELF